MPLHPGRLGIGALLAVVGLLAGAACEDVSVLVVEAASVEISPQDVTVFQDGDRQISAVVRSSAGAILSGRRLLWIIDDSTVAVVSGTGVVRGEQPGSTTVRVRTEGLVGAAPVTVLRRPEIGLSRTDVVIRGVVGGDDPPDEVVEIVNGGGGALSGLSLSITTEGEDDGWLSASLGDSVAPTTLTISTSVGSRSAATYGGAIRVSAPEALDSPQAVQVTLRVEEPPPSIRLVPPSVSFSTVSGSFEPATQSIALTNGGGGTLEDLSTAIEYIDGPTGWLTAELQSTSAPTVLDLAASARALLPGSYRAEVEVSSPLIPDGSRAVEVILQVSSGGDPGP